MIKSLTIVLFLLVQINADTNVSKSWLENQPRSYAKDFFISLYLKQDINASESIWALGQANRVNNKLLYPYAKALNHKETSYTIKCKRMRIKDLVNKDATCIKLGLNLSKINTISKKELHQLKTTIKKEYPDLYKQVDILSSNIPFFKLINQDVKTFYTLFIKSGKVFRENNFNYHLPISLIERLQVNKYQFALVVKLIVTNPKLNKLQESLFKVDASKLKHHTQFFLAINAIKHNKLKLALQYLDESKKTAYYKFDKDKIDYWIYQLNHNEKILNHLAQSWSNNIYSIYAKEKLNIAIENIVFDDSNESINTSTYDIKDPFEWLKVLEDIKKVDLDKKIKYENLFNTKRTTGHLTFIDEKYYKYQKTFLPNPYADLIKAYPIKRQVLINAIAKQESRFIPTSISTSYALGVMQIMPFLSKAIAKELKEPYDIFKQLEAPTNLRYSDHHLDFLERRLDHVIFIAYAYNGGIGFTKRKILKAGLFKKGKYEPYLSMELVPYDESKKYAKKVLVNYLLYNNAMNKNNKITLSELIKSIKNDY